MDAKAQKRPLFRWWKCVWVKLRISRQKNTLLSSIVNSVEQLNIPNAPHIVYLPAWVVSIYFIINVGIDIPVPWGIWVLFKGYLSWDELFLFRRVLLIVCGVAPLPTSQTIKLELTEMLMPPKSDTGKKEANETESDSVVLVCCFQQHASQTCIFGAVPSLFVCIMFFLVLTRLDKTCDGESVQDLDVLPA